MRRLMNSDQAFANGYIEGWGSLIGAVVPMPEIPLYIPRKNGTPYFQGLLDGMATARVWQREFASNRTKVLSESSKNG